MTVQNDKNLSKNANITSNNQPIKSINGQNNLGVARSGYTDVIMPSSTAGGGTFQAVPLMSYVIQDQDLKEKIELEAQVKYYKNLVENSAVSFAFNIGDEVFYVLERVGCQPILDRGIIYKRMYMETTKSMETIYMFEGACAAIPEDRVFFTQQEADTCLVNLLKSKKYKNS